MNKATIKAFILWLENSSDSEIRGTPSIDLIKDEFGVTRWHVRHETCVKTYRRGDYCENRVREAGVRRGFNCSASCSITS